MTTFQYINGVIIDNPENTRVPRRLTSIENDGIYVDIDYDIYVWFELVNGVWEHTLQYDYDRCHIFKDALRIIAGRIPINIYQSRDIQVLEYILSTVLGMFDELKECRDIITSRLLSGKRAIN